MSHLPFTCPISPLHVPSPLYMSHLPFTCPISPLHVPSPLYTILHPKTTFVGKYTYASYLVQTEIGPDDSFKRKLINASHKEAEHYRWLKLQSDTRNPPLDRNGELSIALLAAAKKLHFRFFVKYFDLISGIFIKSTNET